MDAQTLEQAGESLAIETFKILLNKVLSNLISFEQAAGLDDLQRYLPIKIILLEKALTF